MALKETHYVFRSVEIPAPMPIEPFPASGLVYRCMESFLSQMQKPRMSQAQRLARPCYALGPVCGFPSPSHDGFGFMTDSNDLMRLPQAKAPGRLHAGILRQSNFMATSQNAWSGNYLVVLLSPFYHNSAPVNKKFWRALSGDFSEAQVPITVSMALWMRGIANSSIAQMMRSSTLS